jgi:outer membrane protein assembly factor BamB
MASVPAVVLVALLMNAFSGSSTETDQNWSYSTTCEGSSGSGGPCNCFNNNPPTVGHTSKGPILISPAQELLALDPLTGTLLWEGGVNASSNEGITASPLLTKSGVVVYAVEGFFVALNAVSGERLWNHSFVGVNGSWLYVTSPSILTPDERIVIGYGADNSGLTANAFDLSTGQLLWAWYGADIYEYSNAVLKNGVFVTAGSSAYGVNATTGKQLWNFTFNSSNAGQLGASDDDADGVVYVPLFNGSTVAFEARTGKVLWTSASVCGWRAGPMVVADGWLYVLSDCGTVSKISARTGSINWTAIPTQGQATGIPTFADPSNKVLLVAFYGGPIMAISTTTGLTLYNITGDAPSGVTVFNGAVLYQNQCGVYSATLPKDY